MKNRALGVIKSLEQRGITVRRLKMTMQQLSALSRESGYPWEEYFLRRAMANGQVVHFYGVPVAVTD